MKQIRRMILVPVVIILTIAILLIFQVITFETEYPLDNIATITAIVTALLMFGLLMWEVRDTSKRWEYPEPEEPPKSETVIYPKPLDDALEAVEKAEDFVKHANGRIRINIDIEDAREDE
jgi:hypothetical protein